MHGLRLALLMPGAHDQTVDGPAVGDSQDALESIASWSVEEHKAAALNSVLDSRVRD